ncbi:MAG: hypothetical protein KF868_13450 [Acidobacteria bacterium]|nr:hypothetical protein [Acidobacteriota bacterium]
MNHGVSAGRWMRATWAGWLIGIPITILLAIAGEAVGGGGLQFLVGAGMGAGVGLMQGRIIKGVTGESVRWLLSSMIGLSIPFLFTDVARLAVWDIPYSLYVCILVGGLIVGVWQARILRPYFGNSGAWTAACALGWSLAAGSAAVSDLLFQSKSMRGIPGALAYLGVIAAGGLILGAVTGVVIARLTRHPGMEDNGTLHTPN